MIFSKSYVYLVIAAILVFVSACSKYSNPEKSFRTLRKAALKQNEILVKEALSKVSKGIYESYSKSDATFPEKFMNRYGEAVRGEKIKIVRIGTKEMLAIVEMENGVKFQFIKEGREWKLRLKDEQQFGGNYTEPDELDKMRERERKKAEEAAGEGKEEKKKGGH